MLVHDYHMESKTNFPRNSLQLEISWNRHGKALEYGFIKTVVTLTREPLVLVAFRRAAPLVLCMPT